MTLYTKETIALQLVRLLNSSFQWTEAEQMAVATRLTHSHKFDININGQEFTVTVAEKKK